jgi:hypothetical protein
MRPVIGPADLECLASLVDAEEARHARQLIAVEQYESPVERGSGQLVDGRVEFVREEIERIDFPDF